MYYVIAPSNSDLQHHGILGQKWGKQNGPPYPIGSGDHSAAENKAGWRKSLDKKNYKLAKKTLKKSYRSAYNPNPQKNKIYRDSITNIVRNNIKQDQSLKDDIKNVKNKSDKYVNYKLKNNGNTDFTDSKEYDDLHKDAYDKTYKWYEKNDPEYLKDIVKNNNGERAGLDDFHGFRKTYEGYTDELWDKYEKKWNESHTKEDKNAIKEENRLWNEYMDARASIGKKILGDYADIKINKLDKYSSTYGKEFINNMNWFDLYKEVNK